MRNLSLLLALFCLAPLSNFAQLSNGSIAPDLTITDINGVTHDLYADYLDQGKSVLLDLSATWCPPCWSFHNNGVMEDLYDDYGPNSSEYYLIPMMIEVDPSTNMACFFGPTGCNGSTLGDWSGHPYPLCNPSSSEASAINNDFSVSFFPTLYMIAPSGYVQLAPSLGGTSYSVFESWLAESYQMENSTWTVLQDDCALGEIDFNTFQGHGTVSYNWSNGATTEDISGLTTGDYSVTLTDSNGYTVEFGPIGVVGGEQMSEDNVTLTDIDCFGNATGAISINITGGSGNYGYEWSNGSDDGPTIFNLVANDYEVTVTDLDTDCELELEYELEEPDEIEAELTITDAGCGGAMGEIEFDIDGGVSPYEIVIGNNVYTQTTISLSPGSYTAEIIDLHNCSLTQNFTITTLPLPTAISSVSGTIDCADPSVTLSSMGSSSGSEFSYAWYSDNGNFLSNNSTYQASAAGTYTLYVTNTSSNCFSTSDIEVISNVAIPTAVIVPIGSLTCNSTTMTLSASGSSAGNDITYRWSDDNGGNIVGPSTTGTVTIDSGGDYSLLVEDNSNSCENLVHISIVESTTPPSLTLPTNPAICTGESSQICVNVLADQSIEWKNQSGAVINTGSCLTYNTADTFIATLTDNTTGCSNTQSIETTINALPSADISGNLEFCAGGSTVLCHQNLADINYNWSLNGQSLAQTTCLTINQAGQVQLTATNSLTGCSSDQNIQTFIQSAPTASLSTPMGTEIDCDLTQVILDLETTANASITWTDGQGNVISNAEDISVGAGQYLYTVQSSLGCATQGNITITENTGLPQLLLATPETLTCTTTETILNFTTTSSNYDIVWSNSLGSILMGSNPTVTESGVYQAELTDANGCTVQESVTVEDNTTAPVVSIMAPNILDCSTPSVSLELEGDFANNTIDWQNPQGVHIGNAASLTVYEPGTYTATVTGTNGCSTETSMTVTATNDLPEISIAEPEKLGCLHPFVELTLEGDLSGNTYSWINEQGIVLSVDPIYMATSAGNYRARITTPAGCQSEANVTVVESEIIEIMASFDYEVMGNSISLINNNAGAVETSFLWELGDGHTSNEENLSEYTYQDAGDYEICLTTNNECGSSRNCETITIVSALSYELTVQDISCPGGTDGRIIINMTGGTPTYSYAWNDTSISGMGSGNLNSGEYQITVTDAAGVSIVIDITLAEPQPIIAEATITSTSMMDASGQISLAISGGTSPYQIMWDDGSEGMERGGLSQGTYMAVITDANGCQIVSSFIVTGSTAITEIKNLSHFSLSPNPASNEVNIEAEFSEEIKLDISLINARGEKVFSDRVQTDLISRRLDLTNYPSGVYLLELRSGQQVSYRKLIVTK